MGPRACGDAVPAALIALVVVAALAATGLAYDTWVRRRHPARGRILETTDGTRHAIDAGRGEALVLLHGANGTAADFSAELIDDLARDFRVIVPDRPGHGHSRRSVTGRLDLAGEARAVLALLDALGLQRAHLLGHSYGGALALRLALEAPGRVRSVLAVAPIGRVVGGTRVWVGLAGLGVLADAGVLVLGVPVGRFASPGTRVDAWHPEPPPAGWAASRAFPLSPLQIQASLGNLRALARDLAHLRRDLPALRVPARILAAESDRITPPGENAEALAEAGGLPLERVPGAGHWVLRTHAPLVAARLRALAEAARSPEGVRA